MSFTDNAIEAVERTEASLHALMADALKAKAYAEVAAIAAIAQSLAAIKVGRDREDRPAIDVGMSTPVAEATADAGKSAEPSWMRPKS